MGERAKSDDERPWDRVEWGYGEGRIIEKMTLSKDLKEVKM